MATELPYPLAFKLTLKGDPNTTFNIDINKRVAVATNVKEQVTERVCATFRIDSSSVQSVLFHENRLNGLFTLQADDIVDAHTTAARLSNWKDGDPPFILPLEVEFTYPDALPSNLPVSTVVSLPTVEQQQYVPLNQKHKWLDTAIRDQMVMHLSGDEKYGVYFPCKVSGRSQRLRYEEQGDFIQSEYAMEQCAKAVMELPAYKEKPIKPDEVKDLITQKVNDQRKYHGPGVKKRNKDGEPCVYITVCDHKVIVEMKRRKVEKEKMFQKTVAARVVEQNYLAPRNTSDAGLSTRTGFRTPSAQAVPALTWRSTPVEPREPPRQPLIVPNEPLAGDGDGIGDAGDDAGGTDLRSGGDDEDGDNDGAGSDVDFDTTPNFGAEDDDDEQVAANAGATGEQVAADADATGEQVAADAGATGDQGTGADTFPIAQPPALANDVVSISVRKPRGLNQKAIKIAGHVRKWLADQTEETRKEYEAEWLGKGDTLSSPVEARKLAETIVDKTGFAVPTEDVRAWQVALSQLPKALDNVESGTKPAAPQADTEAEVEMEAAPSRAEAEQHAEMERQASAAQEAAAQAAAAQAEIERQAAADQAAADQAAADQAAAAQAAAAQAAADQAEDEQSSGSEQGASGKVLRGFLISPRRIRKMMVDGRRERCMYGFTFWGSPDRKYSYQEAMLTVDDPLDWYPASALDASQS